MFDMLARLSLLLSCVAARTASRRRSFTAQDWPNRPVRFIVPFPAGGSTDVGGAACIAEYLSRTLGQQVFVENRTGANGNIGMEAAAKSAPDGYTVLIAPDSVASNPHVFKVSFDPLKDLVPVIQLSRQPIVLAAHPSLGVSTLAELIALAKQQPGLRYAHRQRRRLAAAHGRRSGSRKLAGIELEQVPYRGGGQAINDLIAGHIKLGSLGSTPLIPHLQGRHVAAAGAERRQARSPSLPDVPTYQEAGSQGLVLDQWLGVLRAGRHAARRDPRVSMPRSTRRSRTQRSRDSFLQSAQEPIGGKRRAVRPSGARRFREIRTAGEGLEYQVELARRANRTPECRIRRDGRPCKSARACRASRRCSAARCVRPPVRG